MLIALVHAGWIEKHTTVYLYSVLVDSIKTRPETQLLCNSIVFYSPGSRGRGICMKSQLHPRFLKRSYFGLE